MKRLIVTIVVGLGMLTAADARAQDTEKARAEAQVLNKEGVELLGKKDFGGALDRFQRAYAAFPSPKVLLNVAAALKELGRKSDAANVYQKWLDDPGAESAKRAEVQKILSALEADSGVITITVDPADAEVQIDVAPPGWLTDASAWLPARQVALWRVPAGPVVVRARKAGYQDAEKAITVDDAVKQAVALTLTIEEKPVETPVVVPENPEVPPDDPEPIETPQPRPVKSVQLGAALEVAIDGTGHGAAVSPGVVIRFVDRIDVVAKAQISGSKGAYLGASVALLRGRFRPFLGAGVPVFFSDGARFGARGAVGLSVELGKLSIFGEAGGEYFFNPEMDFVQSVFVPVVGVRGRL
jgi:hypothetical protein